MTQLRSSNSDRANYRAKCRQKLSEHILNTLQISILPSEVRLITSAEDPYSWQVLPEKRHLFRKHLSKHSVGAYRELSRGVGVWFEAVANNFGSLPEQRNAAGNSPGSETSFITVIEGLKADNLELTDKLMYLSGQITKATESKRLAEDEATRCKANMQLAEMEKQRLQEEVQSLTNMAERFKYMAAKSVAEFVNRMGLDLKERCTESCAGSFSGTSIQ